jgi:acyl-CoA hydrolase
MVDLGSVIRPGDGIVWGQACAEPQTLVEELVSQRAQLGEVGCFLGSSYSGIVRPEHAEHLRLASYCGTGTNRALADAGVLEIVPVPYSQLGTLIRSKRIKCDVVMIQVSPPNARGEYSLGLGVEYLAPALEVARAVIAEVNDQIPWTHTEPLLRERDFAVKVPNSRKPVYMAFKLDDIGRAIARHAKAFIPDGAVLECGIGNLPNAVLMDLGERRGLSLHSGLIPDAVTGLELRWCVGGALMGSQRLFDWARDNEKLRLCSSDITHGAAALGKLERFVAINSAVEVDLTGQINGELAGESYVGAVGGALDFVRAANQSSGGVAITVVQSSRVVERLDGPVSVPRSEAGIIVTEKGAADLRGCSLRERERRMRAISSLSGNS